MKSLLLPLALTIPAALFAGPTIAPTGNELYLTMGPSNTADLVINGGRFDGRLGTSPTNANNTLVNLWCVDAQLYFNWNTPYRANSLGFSAIDGEGASGNTWTAGTGGSRDVRYEDALAPGQVMAGGTAASTPNFLFSTGYNPPGADPDDLGEEALFRYRMAGYLLDQYSSLATYDADQTTVFVNGVDAQFGTGKYDPRNSARNQALIGAIWAAMDTDTDNDNRPALAGAVQTWFNRAAAYVNTNWANSGLWSKWVVVSGWAGTTYVENSGGPVQTFLTERTPIPQLPNNPVPEPGFYGLLCTGLGALVWVANRRKQDDGAKV